MKEGHGPGLRILVTSDVHLGMKFSAYPEAQHELSEARFQCLDRIVDRANRERCDMIVIAGDLFDRLKTPKEQIVRAASSLNGFEGELVAVLPGNHDYATGGRGSLWGAFTDAAGDRVLVLTEGRPYDLAHYDLDVRLFPGPCHEKHSKDNALAWLDGAQPAAPIPLRIAVAHGSVEGLSYDSEGVYYPLKRAWMEAAGMDLWIVGHSHTPHSSGPCDPLPLYVPGCPEPDGFDCSHEGRVWLLDIGRDRRVSAVSLVTGAHRFVTAELTVPAGGGGETGRTPAAVTPDPQRSLRSAIEAALALETPLDEPSSDAWGRTLARITLRGRLPREDRKRLEERIAALESSLLLARIDDTGVAEEITPELVDIEFTQGSFPHRLLHTLLQLDDDAAVRMAYDLLQEAGPQEAGP